MTYAQILECLAPTDLSPEKLAPYFSVSNMTFRRWKDKKNATVDENDMKLIVDGVFLLIADGHLSMESKEIQTLIEKNFHSPAYFSSVMKTLGLEEAVSSRSNFEEKIIDSLHAIGDKENKRSYVESKLASLPEYFKKAGKDFKERTQTLVKVIKSKEISRTQKFIAYGALFYLFLPFDLIPDHIPVFGLMDDFAILGFAVAYYAKFGLQPSKQK